MKFGMEDLHKKKTVTNVILVSDPLQTLPERCRQKSEDYIRTHLIEIEYIGVD
jgi:hypothetical protein